MGIFKKIFGSDDENKGVKKTQRQLLRDTRKNRKYFEKEIERSIKFLDDDYKIENKTSFDFWRISMGLIRIIILEYSAGMEINQRMKERFITALKYYVKGWTMEEPVTYESLLNMISLAILFDINSEDFSELIKYVENTDKYLKQDWFPDGFIWRLIDYNTGVKKDINNLQFPKKYTELFSIMDQHQKDAEYLVKEYLKKWYKLSENESWYDSHLKVRGYKGYWAWEVAAVVKKMGLDDSSFKDNPYYPYDMVHWNKNIKPD